MDSNNNNTTMLNNNKQLIEERKRKMTLEFSNPQINTESLNTPQLMSILANDNKRLKPDSLPLQTPTQIIETPTIQITTPMLDKLIRDNFLDLGTTPSTSASSTIIAIPLSTQHQQQQNQQQPLHFLNTPKNEKDMSELFDRAFNNVKNQNTSNSTNNYTNNNNNNSYAILQPVHQTSYININSSDKSIGHNILFLQQHQQQHQHHQQQHNNNTNNNLINKNNNNNNNNTNIISIKEEQTVPVHHTNGKPGKITPAKRQSRKTSSQTTNSNTNTNKLASSSMSSNSSSPERTQTPNLSHDGQPITPINLDHQEAIKIEKKRERNREAARKCRTRKLEKIATLEQQVKELNAKNVKITDESNLLKEEINNLKQRLQQHKQIHGCELTSI